MTTDWFHPWLERHLQRHATAGLPEIDKKPLFYENWRDQFTGRGVTYEQAEAASRVLATQKYVKLHHFKALLDLIQQARAASSSIETAEVASKSCTHCYGTGFATVTDRESKMNFAAYCICPLGTYKLRRAKREAKEHERLLDLASILNGEIYRAKINGRVVDLDFSDDTDFEDHTANLPPGLRKLAEKLRPEPEPARY